MKVQRRDIQGLRAVAVMLVISNHVFGWPGGGYIGVDVFFVLSGFLITGLLLREHDLTGKISFSGFYKRRIKRILPAALAVTVVTVAVGFAVLPRVRFELLVGDALWATLFASNWRSVIMGTDYMHVDDAVSPLQHFWSLSIEEQFYFVWPLLLLLALTYGATRPRRRAGIVISVIGLASFTFAVWETAAHPTSAYFSTFSRVWELAAGAILALGAAKARAIPPALQPILAWAGLATIAVSALIMTESTPFPGPWALAPVLGTVAVIAAGISGEQRYLLPLTNPMANYVGNISYSLYLWHYPALVFSTMFLPETPRRLVVSALVLTALLSVASYHLIENPVRFNVGRARLVRPLGTVLVIAIASVSLVTFAPRQSGDVTVATAETPVVERLGDSPAELALWADLDAALAAQDWPDDLSPAVTNVRPEDKASEWVVDGCLGNEARADDDAITNALRCTYGDAEASKTAVVFGDSTAIGWVPGVRAALEPLGYRVEVLTFQQCPTVDIATNYSDGSAMPDCAVFRDWAISHIEETRPDVVVSGNVPATLGRLSSGAYGEAAQKAWEEASRASMLRLQDAAEKVVVLQAPPTRNYTDACELKGSSPSDCYMGRSPVYGAMFEADKAASEGLEVDFVNTGSWFCSPDGRCPSYVNSDPVVVDGPHLTENRSIALAPVLAEVLTRD